MSYMKDVELMWLTTENWRGRQSSNFQRILRRETSGLHQALENSRMCGQTHEMMLHN